MYNPNEEVEEVAMEPYLPIVIVGPDAHKHTPSPLRTCNVAACL